MLPDVLRRSRRLRRLSARRRLRRVNLRRAESAQRAPIPAPPSPVSADVIVPTTYGAPRTLLYVTVKRDNTTWRSLYGHWWLEVGDESYGWWPAAVPLGVKDLLRGTQGVLNGMGLLRMKGTWHRDPNHGLPAMHEFHPELSVVRTDEDVRLQMRSFAHRYRTRWHWSWNAERSSGTCRSFQDELLAEVGCSIGPDQLHTRGSGCPFLYPLRQPLWLAADMAGDVRTRGRRRGRSGQLATHPS